MPAGSDDANSRHDDRIAGDEVEHTGVGERNKILLEIARSISDVGVRLFIPLTRADDVARAWEGRHDSS